MSESIAEKIFVADHLKAYLRANLSDAGVKHESIRWDCYDNSLELHGVPADTRLSEAAQRIVHAAGFSRVYVKHVDNWETHYRFADEFAVTVGWRVSHPHNRGDGDPAIWVEKIVPGWPAEWFENGKCVVKIPK